MTMALTGEENRKEEEMKKVTKKDKWTHEIVEALIDGQTSLRDLRKKMTEDGMSGTAMNDCIHKAKEIIKNEANDVKDVSFDLNILRLSDIADTALETSDRLSGIDKLNKMIGAYTQNINIAENVRFILGDVEAFENDFKETDTDEQ